MGSKFVKKQLNNIKHGVESITESEEAITEFLKKITTGDSWDKYGSGKVFAKDLAMIALAPIASGIASAAMIVLGFIGVFKSPFVKDSKATLKGGAAAMVLGVGLALLAGLSPLIRAFNILARTFHTAATLLPKPVGNEENLSEDFQKLQKLGGVESFKERVLKSMIYPLQNLFSGSQSNNTPEKEVDSNESDTNSDYSEHSNKI